VIGNSALKKQAMKNDAKTITEYMFLETKPEQADLIIVFGTRHKEASLRASQRLCKNDFSKRRRETDHTRE